MYEAQRKFSTELGGRPLIVETGKMSELSNGSCLVRYGDTTVLCNATASAAPRPGIDFLPLSVDYEERLYSVGRIPGSWNRREGRPTDKAILTARVIDRPVRPLFPKDMRNDVAVSALVLSVDQDCSPEIAAMIGTSIALSISDIPWNGPISAVSVGYVDGQYVINPTAAEREVSEMAVTVASSAKKVVMIEAGAKEVTEEVMFNGIKFGHEANIAIVDFINGIVAEIGKTKFEYPSADVDHDMFDAINEFAHDKLVYALDTADKNVREERLKVVTAEVNEHFEEIYPDSAAAIAECLYKAQKLIVRHMLKVDHKRVDGRALNEMRPLYAEVDVIPRVHGSAIFARGQTQALTIATLGSIGDKQLLDGIDTEESKRYMHHYNMPGYSVGEAKASRSPGRREIGHGALGERALLPVIPSEEEFPYTIRLVSEILTSNGSTSQASICGSTLALMAAGVPIKAPVAGISCGLITDGDDYLTMVDIQGLEDFFGDMDFKVAGTKKGITAIQMDLKVDGLTFEIIKEALEKTRDARYHIIDEVILKAIDAPRAELSEYAPKVMFTQIEVDKIREVIGSGGKVIQQIIADTGVNKIDIDDDGKVFISCIDKRTGEHALSIINAIVKEPEIGAIFKGKVTRIMSFGAFVEYAPGKEGLVRINQLDFKHIEKIEDILSIGDHIWVKVIEIDSQGRINMSRKAALREMQEKKNSEASAE